MFFEYKIRKVFRRCDKKYFCVFFATDEFLSFSTTRCPLPPCNAANAEFFRSINKS